MAENTPSRPARWVKPLLVVSLAVNLIVAGLIGGAMLRGGPPEQMHPDRSVSALGLRLYLRALPADQRRQIAKDARARRGEFKLGPKLIRAHMRALAAAVEAEPFDPETLRVVLSAQSASVAGNMAIGQDILIDRIAAMTEAERKEFAAALRKPPRR